MNTKEAPKEVQDMRSKLAEVRRAARGVKDSARGLRVLRKSEQFTALTGEAMEHYDSAHPPTLDDETTRRVR